MTVGYELGMTHGRIAERRLIEQERRSAVAGEIVRRLADIPGIAQDEMRRRREGRATTLRRIADLPSVRGRSA